MDNSLSIIPSEGATNEFPVLKAFQEYIDAEQAKARKRMLGLSVFFIVLLIVVVVTFVLILTTVVNRNQALSDRLLDYALKEREKQQTVVPQPAPAPASQPPVQDILKPFIDRLEREQAAMKSAYEKQQKEAEAKAKELEAKFAEKEAARVEELRKARAELDKERARAKKANDRQEEIERQRRRLYPDYYRMQPPSQPAADAVLPPPAAVPAARPAVKPKPSKPKAEAKPAPDLSTLKPVTYFNMDDEDGVPFILETPPSKK